MGFNTKLLKGVRHDAVFAELTADKLLPTVLIYGHYDVQPPEPLEEWKTPPFKPTIKGNQIYARGSSDNKGQIMIHLMAVKKLIEKSRNPKSNRKLPINFKFIIEGEEEIGSPSVGNLVKRYSKNLLKCDYLLVSDTEMPSKGQPSIDISLRGLLYAEVEVQSARHDLHSGLYGGVAENPAIVLSKMISKLKDDTGHVLIPHFYDSVKPFSKEELKDFSKLKITPSQIIRESGIYQTTKGEKGFSLEERLWTRPTLDVNGIWGGYQGEGSKTIIPSKSCAKISMRLVPDQNPNEVYKNFVNYMKKTAPNTVKLRFIRHADCLPYKAPTQNKVFDLMKKSLKKVFGKNPVYKGVGGSIGFVPITAKALNVPCLLVGFALPDGNIHAPNERFSLSNYFKGIEAMSGFYSNLDKKNRI
jgi:acetylornithine deacetylase/succinyl-diaminopimelate desuccinylase-like protein